MLETYTRYIKLKRLAEESFKNGDFTRGFMYDYEAAKAKEKHFCRLYEELQKKYNEYRNKVED